MGYRVKNEKRWPDRKIPYVFHDNLDAQTRELFKQCMERWEQFLNEGITYVQFVARTNEELYVQISATEVGSTGTGELGKPTAQNMLRFTFNVNRKNGRDDRNSIPHELGHVMGLAHEHQRSRPNFDDNGNPLDGTADEAEVKDAAQARLYYMGGAGRFDDKFKPIPRATEKKNQLAAWSNTYVAVGPYDLQSIMHYPDAPNWQWNYEPYRLDEQAALAALNYPSAEQVVAGRWEPSPGDIATLRDLYPP